MTMSARLLRLFALAIVPLLGAVPGPASAHERAELEQMLAPIALYPDSVLSHVLIAATYPGEVEEAARWSRRHPDLHGEDAVDAVDDRDWDPSVKALVAFPEILARMDEDPDWTEDLGDAFLEHEAEVMDSVQTLRDHAYDAGHLRSTDHVRVVREREYIYIEPAVHHVVYVPYYDPWYVYGSWWWPAHPPYRWRHWHGRAVSYYGTGFYWGVGFRIAPTFYFTSFYWPERYVVVTHHHHANYRPLYSGRHVTRQPEVRHWREQRATRVEDRQPRNQRREERGSAAQPEGSRGRGADARRPREDRTDKTDDARRNRTWRTEPGAESRRDEKPRREREDRERSRGTPREGSREDRRSADEGRRQDAPGRERRHTDDAPARSANPERARGRPEHGGPDRDERNGRGRDRGDAPERERGRDEASGGGKDRDNGTERGKRENRKDRTDREERKERGGNRSQGDR